MRRSCVADVDVQYSFSKDSLQHPDCDSGRYCQDNNFPSTPKATHTIVVVNLNMPD